MDPLTMGLISGGANLLGSIFSSSTSASNTQEQIAAQQQMQGQTEQFNAQQAQVQRDYETQMSNTAYQRASKDMQAAGLNPMMMFGSGSAASTPSGSTASVGTPSVPMPQKTSALAGLGNAVSSGLTSAITAKTMDKLTQEVVNLQADKALTDQERDYMRQRTGKTEQDREIDEPTATKARALNSALVEHPTLTTAAEVGKYGSEAVGAGTKAVGNILGLGGRIGSAIDDVTRGTSSTAADTFRKKLYTLPQARQRMLDLENSFQQ